jgi:hypothetical protein
MLDVEDLHVHTSQLTPDLSEDTNVSTVNHTRPKEFQVGYVGVLAFKVNSLLYFC